MGRQTKTNQLIRICVKLQRISATLLLLTVSPVLASNGLNEKFADTLSSKVASSWFELLYDVVKAEKTTPPLASRVYGVTSVALYESIVGGTKGNRSLVGQLNGLTSVPQPDKD